MHVHLVVVVVVVKVVAAFRRSSPRRGAGIDSLLVFSRLVGYCTIGYGF